jgi:Uma2 family endonuclease
VTFVRGGRLANLKAGELRIAPDLVVEVVSTHDEAREVEN